MPPSEPCPKLFSNEHLARAENRINLALFGAQAIPAFWTRFSDLVGIPKASWLERRTTIGTSLRPDFFVVSIEKDLAVIEVELGGQDKDQLDNYRKKFAPLTVISIVGLASNPAMIPSLQEIRQIALEEAERMGVGYPQAKSVLQALAHLIHQGKPSASAKAATTALRQEFLSRFEVALAPLLQLQKLGFLENIPINPKSVSLKLKSGPLVECTSGFALLTMTDADTARLPSPAIMRSILQGPLLEVADRWEALLCKIFRPSDPKPDGNGRINIPANALERHGADFAEMYAPLTRHI